MSNLIPLEQAAKMLGITPERIVEMISKKQIFGMRDGSQWKFKAQEIERVADELGLELPGQSQEDDGDFSLSDSSINDDLIIDDSDEDEDFELSDDLSSAISSSKNKANGVKSKSDSDDDSDFDLSDDSSDLILQDSGTDLGKPGSPKSPKQQAAAKSAVGEEDDLLLFGDSSLELAAEKSKKKKGDSGVHDQDLALHDDPSGSTGKLLKAMKGKVSDSKDELSLSEDELFDDDLKLADSDSLEDAVDLGSDYEDSDLVLDDSDSSSDLVLESNEKGISLKPSDSGIEVSRPLQVGGSDIDDLDFADDDMVSLAESADSDAATLMQEDDFNLTPFEDKDTDDSSGSQVIALEDSDLFASDSEATLLSEAEMQAQPPMLADALATPSGATPTVSVASPEVPFTLWQVMALGLTVAILLVGLPVIFDTARNLWLPSNQVTHNGILNMILEMTGMNR